MMNDESTLGKYREIDMTLLPGWLYVQAKADERLIKYNAVHQVSHIHQTVDYSIAIPKSFWTRWAFNYFALTGSSKLKAG
jgi:hypothetical protein